MKKAKGIAGRCCPQCGKEKNQVMAGKNRSGTQRCFCNECKKYYTLDPKTREIPEEIRLQAIKTYYAGTSGRGVGKVFGFSKANVYNWIRSRSESSPKKNGKPPENWLPYIGTRWTLLVCRTKRHKWDTGELLCYSYREPLTASNCGNWCGVRQVARTYSSIGWCRPTCRKLLYRRLLGLCWCGLSRETHKKYSQQERYLHCWKRQCRFTALYSNITTP